MSFSNGSSKITPAEHAMVCLPSFESLELRNLQPSTTITKSATVLVDSEELSG